MKNHQTWSPEPWMFLAEQSHAMGMPGVQCQSMVSDGPNGGYVQAKTPGPDGEANAKRIVACVNACRGIVNPEAIGEVVEALESAARTLERFGAPRSAKKARAALRKLEENQ